LKNPMYKTQIEYLRYGKVPDKYMPQMRFSMIVTGLREWDFMSYARGLPPLLRTCVWDSKTDALAKEMDKFWEKHQAALKVIKDMFSDQDDFAEHEEQIAVAKMF